MGFQVFKQPPITINRVNDCPTVVSPSNITVNEDAPDSVIDVVSIFSDPDLSLSGYSKLYGYAYQRFTSYSNAQ